MPRPRTQAGRGPATPPRRAPSNYKELASTPPHLLPDRGWEAQAATPPVRRHRSRSRPVARTPRAAAREAPSPEVVQLARLRADLKELHDRALREAAVTHSPGPVPPPVRKEDSVLAAVMADALLLPRDSDPSTAFSTEPPSAAVTSELDQPPLVRDLRATQHRLQLKEAENTQLRERVRDLEGRLDSREAHINDLQQRLLDTTKQLVSLQHKLQEVVQAPPAAPVVLPPAPCADAAVAVLEQAGAAQPEASPQVVGAAMRVVLGTAKEAEAACKETDAVLAALDAHRERATAIAEHGRQAGVSSCYPAAPLPPPPPEGTGALPAPVPPRSSSRSMSADRLGPLPPLPPPPPPSQQVSSIPQFGASGWSPGVAFVPPSG